MAAHLLLWFERERNLDRKAAHEPYFVGQILDLECSSSNPLKPGWWSYGAQIIVLSVRKSIIWSGKNDDFLYWMACLWTKCLNGSKNQASAGCDKVIGQNNCSYAKDLLGSWSSNESHWRSEPNDISVSLDPETFKRLKWSANWSTHKLCIGHMFMGLSLGLVSH